MYLFENASNTNMQNDRKNKHLQYDILMHFLSLFIYDISSILLKMNESDLLNMDVLTYIMNTCIFIYMSDWFDISRISTQ